MSGMPGWAPVLRPGAGLEAAAARVAEIRSRLGAADPAPAGPDMAGGPVALVPGMAAPSGAFASVLGSEAIRLGAASPAPSPQPLPGLDPPATLSDLADTGAEMVRPLPGARTSLGFGPTSFALEPPAVVGGVRYAHFHDGLDLAAPLGSPVRAAAAGVVVAAGRQSDGAVVVRIRHPDGSESRYGHLQPRLSVQAGATVAAGQVIGSVGVTGRTTGPHLHFELVVGGEAVDPAPLLAAGRLPATARPADGAAQPLARTGLAAFDAVAATIPYAGQIRTAAVAAGIDPLLLASLVRAESGFRADAVSSAGALGLAQLMPANVKSLGVADPFDPAQNVRAAARYLANNLRLYGRTDLALAAYQAGKGAVARAGGIPGSPVTRNYVDRILGYWSGYLEDAQTTKGAASA